jgi:small-conductance mechanosensitive channel
MKQGSTLFLKIVLVLATLAVLAGCILWLPAWAKNDIRINPDEAIFRYSVLVAVYSIAILFFVSTYQAIKLLHYIDKNKLFSASSVASMKVIKYCSITATTIIALGIVLFRIFVGGDDAAGPTGLGIILTFVSCVIGTCAAVLQKLLQNAVDLKSENDLTV